jgi:WS/DGAT/MGAT family acyltransferase
MKSLNAFDRVFLAGESRESMMHVGSLVPFSPPPSGGQDVLRALMDELRVATKVESPWNLRLRHPWLLTSPLQAWVEDDRVDLQYHVRRSALPSPGDERELGVLVSRLHSTPIDFHRPPWEVHVIEGLTGGRVALYTKVHHALIDGFTGVKLLTRAMSTDPGDLHTPMFFSRAPAERAPHMGPRHAKPSALSGLADEAIASKDAARALFRLAMGSRGSDRTLVAPFDAPETILNRAIKRSRRFATQEYAIERLKRVSKGAGGTLNDVVLALVGGALRRYLLDENALPAKPLTVMMPVNVRPKDDPGGGGNAVGGILASLATDEADPKARLLAIIRSTTRAKEQLAGMSKKAILDFTAVLLAPMMLASVPGLAGRVRPTFNVVVSNVPGPEVPLYFRGWRMEAVFPLSIPFNGYGLNVTVESYAGMLDFGFTGCRDTVPHLQRLAVYAGEELEQLERLVRS